MSDLAFITLGCAKNEVDSDTMRARVVAAGHTLVDDPALADIVVINTCAFITEATEEAIAVILKTTQLPRVVAGQARVVVAGCLVSRYSAAELTEELPEVSSFLSVEDEDQITALLGGDQSADTADTPAPQFRTVNAAWAYLKIADGCDRRCAFCTIPFIRGPYQSRSADEIIAEATELVSGGVRELVLIAQDTGRWRGAGKQQGQPANLAQLLDVLARRFSGTWIRIMYLQPSGITAELLTVMAAHQNICNYLDIPLQHASARVLADMNRTGSSAEYLELLAQIRAALPDVVIRTTVIAGFPGETRADARELERFIAAAEFDYVGVFPYSQEEGTIAGERSDQVPKRTRLARAQRLRDQADAVGFARAQARVDSMVEVLITEWDEEGIDPLGSDLEDLESSDPYPLLGRTRGQAPEVDGMVHLDIGTPGERVSARIIEAYCYELDGRVCDA
jgi:ribosomal protein S12 methylthiotransferase